MLKGDYYICALAKKLFHVSNKYRKSESNYISEVTIYECENCRGCPYKNKYTKAKGNNRLYVSKEFINKRKKSLENITTPEEKLLRLNRSIQVEGAFRVLKQDFGFRIFLLRGKKNIKFIYIS